MNIVTNTVELIKRLTTERKQCTSCEHVMSVNNFRVRTPQGRRESNCRQCEKNKRLLRHYAARQRNELINGYK